MEHPIPNMLKVSLENLRNIVDCDTIIGEPIEGINNIKVIPVSKVKLGFASGGSEFNLKNKEELPFGGGAGGTLSVTPIAFLVFNDNDVKVLHMDENTHLFEKVLDKITEGINHFTETKN